MDSEKINAEVISVSPDKVKIMIYNMDNWKTAEDKMIEKKAGKGKTVIITAISTDGTNKKANEQIKIK